MQRPRPTTCRGWRLTQNRLTGIIERDRSLFPGFYTGKMLSTCNATLAPIPCPFLWLGAASVTGYDFSPSALDVARRLAAKAQADITYVEGELYDAIDVLGRHRFDVVYTGTGALNRLPDIAGWAKVAAGLLRSSGVLHLHEYHPLLWCLDQRPDDMFVIEFPYFETPEPLAFDEGPSTYTDGDALSITHTVTRQMNDGLGEIVQSVIDAGLVVTAFYELRYCDSLFLPNVMERRTDGAAVLRTRPERLPLSYTLQVRQPGSVWATAPKNKWDGVGPSRHAVDLPA